MTSKAAFSAIVLALFVAASCGKSDDKPRQSSPTKPSTPQPTPAKPTAPDASTAPVKKRNLKVLPNTLSKKALKRLMKRQAKALGMDCSDCHDTDDFAADTEPAKKVARKMMTMVDELNGKFFKDDDAKKLTCFTCHQGKPKPDQQKGHFADGHTH